MTVYGYHPYWGADPTTLDFSRLTHLAIFNVDLKSDGTLADTHRWTDVAGDVVPLAPAEGVSVQLCVSSFDDDVMASVLPDPTKRARAIAELVALVDDYDADGDDDLFVTRIDASDILYRNDGDGSLKPPTPPGERAACRGEVLSQAA